MERSGASASAPSGPEDQVEVGSQRNLDRLNATGTGDLELAGKAAAQADVGDDVFGSAVLVDDLGRAGGGEFADLLGLFAQIDSAGMQLQVKLGRFAF